jgi:cytochrome P450
VVRTSLTTVSFSSPASAKAIHKIGSGFQKSALYGSMQLRGTLFCLTNNKEHSSRRKHFAKAFSQQNLLEWEDVISCKVKFAISKLKNAGRGGVEVDILREFSAMATDVVAELCFGDSFKSGPNGNVSSLSDCSSKHC